MINKLISTKTSFGRQYFLRYILDSLVLNYLGKRSAIHLRNGFPQLAVSTFDGIGNTINIRGVYELEHLTTITNWLRKNHFIVGCALDIGANIGNHSVHFSKLYTHVFSFEPNPKTYQLLSINSTISPNITTFNYGLSSKAGEAKLYVCNLNWGGAKIESSPIRSDRVETIKLSTLDAQDQLIEQKIGLIKIDVEGHEIEVLKGGVQTIMKNKPIILFEQHPNDFLNDSTPSLDFLKKIGYKTFAILMPYPYLPLWIPRRVRSLFTIIIRLIFGYGFQVEVTENIKSDFHSLIVAIPSIE